MLGFSNLDLNSKKIIIDIADHTNYIDNIRYDMSYYTKTWVSTEKVWYVAINDPEGMQRIIKENKIKPESLANFKRKTLSKLLLPLKWKCQNCQGKELETITKDNVLKMLDDFNDERFQRCHQCGAKNAFYINPLNSKIIPYVAEFKIDKLKPKLYTTVNNIKKANYSTIK